MPRRPKTFYDRFDGEVVNFAGVRVKVGRIPVSSLKLWTENPRLEVSHVYKSVRRTQQHIEQELSDIPKLMTSLDETRKTNDDADIVGMDVYVDANGVVWEGNRRIVASRRLVEEGKNQFRNIFAVVFPEAPAAYERLKQLVNKRHLAGIKEWGAVNKALHAEKVYDSIRSNNPRLNNGEVLRKTAYEVGWSPGYADQVFRALRMWKRLNRETGCTDTKKWSYVYEVANKFIGDAPKLLPLIANGQVSKMVDLRAWPLIKQNNAAYSIFQRRGFKEAKNFVERYSGDDTALIATLNKASNMVAGLMSNRKRALVELVASQTTKMKKAKRAFSSLQANVVLVANQLERMKEEIAAEKRARKTAR